jgi:dTDP-4-amino-4,6-dideoxygalactose transaminase
MSYRIPFNRPSMAGRELDYIQDAIQRGHASGDGLYTKQCHTLLEKILGVPKILLTTNCTHALEMAAILLNLQAGDEVIVPAFTFVSGVNAFVLRGARPIFADIRPDTLNIDETKLEALISPRTRAISLVHYAGVGCEMDSIMEIADHHGIPVIEDNAHALFGKYKGQYLGTFGALATQSFHETKNIQCGEGGALVINDTQYSERAEIIREKGTNRARFFRGQVDKYTWVDIGSSYLPSDMLAAFLYAQLECHTEIQAKRQHIWESYNSQLLDWATRHGIRLPIVPAEVEQAYHMYYILMPSLESRTALINHLKQHGILSVFHYLPLHLSDMGRDFGGKVGDCPVTEDISDRLLRLPFYNTLTDNDLNDVITTLQSF